MLVNSHQGLHDEGHEAQILFWRLTGSVEQHAIIGAEAPVVMLTTTIDAIEGLLVEQYAETMLACHLLHQRHQQHVMVDGQVALLEDRSQFKLVGRYLVVTGLYRDGEFQRLNLKILHEGHHAIGNCSEVVVIHLLVLCTLMSHQCATGHQQVWTGRVETLVNEEILLFPT